MISLALGCSAMLLAWNWMMPAPAVPTSNQQIVVAARALSAGSKLAADSVKTIAWNGTSLPAGALRDPAQLQGRVLKSQAVADAPILEPMLLPVGAAMGLAADLAPGMRAMTLRVDQVVGVAGFVMPGDLVDVLLTGNAEAYKLYGRKSPPQTNSAMTQKMAFSKVVLEKVRVLAVAQQTDHGAGEPKVADTVTLALSAEQAVKLDLARSLGQLALALRNLNDADSVPGAVQLEPGLLHSASAPVATVPKRRCVQVIEGGQVQQQCHG